MALTGLAEAAATGRPWVVWVEGEAGSGKTALVRRAVAVLPSGFGLVRVQADELATAIAYELARQLGAVQTDNPFAAGMDILGAWSAAQDNGPVALVVEDFHWADVGSRQAERLHDHTRGHPLWVRTLLAELSPAQLQAVDGELPAPRSLASSVTARLSEVPADAQALAAAMAVVNQRSSLPMLGRAAGLAAPLGPFEALLDTGFVRWDPGQPAPLVEFAHPLYRQAVYEDLSPTRRRDLHRAVASVMIPAAVLAHRVAAADGVDDGLADELEAAARREIDAGSAALGPVTCYGLPR